MKRPKSSPPPAKGKWMCPDASFSQRYPSLAQYLCDAMWEDGQPRQLSSLSVKMDSSSVSLSLSDHETSSSAYTTATSLQEALELMEAGITAGTVVFRPWKGPRKK